MKKLALIGMVVAGLLLSTSTAWAKPTGMTKAEFQALITPSEGSNVTQQLEEIGAWAVPTKQPVSTPLVSEKLAGVGIPGPETTVSSTGGGFDWNDAGIGAAFALGGVLGIGAVLTVRHHQHSPIAH
jgi:hypothetical protein